jgi:hypothetical protein
MAGGVERREIVHIRKQLVEARTRKTRVPLRRGGSQISAN